MTTGHVQMRDMTKDDIPHILDYWFNSPPSFIDGMGIDLQKLPERSDLGGILAKQIDNNSKLESTKLSTLVGLLDGVPKGHCLLHPIVENDHGYFHAHIWTPEERNQGRGLLAYTLACKEFVKRFNLKKIVTKIPTQNISAIRINEKLGIPYIGEVELNQGLVKKGTIAKHYEWSRAEIERVEVPSETARIYPAS